LVLPSFIKLNAVTGLAAVMESLVIIEPVATIPFSATISSLKVFFPFIVCSHSIVTARSFIFSSILLINSVPFVKFQILLFKSATALFNASSCAASFCH
jgi:hypothetical protein